MTGTQTAGAPAGSRTCGLHPEDIAPVIAKLEKINERARRRAWKGATPGSWAPSSASLSTMTRTRGW